MTETKTKQGCIEFNPATYKPANHHILVRYLPRETKGGIILPASTKASPRVEKWQAEVIAISPATDLKDAGIEDLKPGDVVDTLAILTASWSEEYNGEVYAMICDGDIAGRR